VIRLGIVQTPAQPVSDVGVVAEVFGPIGRSLRSATTPRSAGLQAGRYSHNTTGVPVPTIFTRIIEGELPGRIIWRDDTCVAMVDIRPLNTGHVLVVPLAEVDRWTDLPAETAAHCTVVAHAVGQAQMAVFAPARIGLMIAGFEVPHTHLHVVPINHMGHLDFTEADPEADASHLDVVAEQLRCALRSDGHTAVV